MPINIYNGDTYETINWLCDESWELPYQMYKLQNWLDEKGRYLVPANYVADIGFDIRKNATGGGAVLDIKAMEIMVKIGMRVYFSEYPSERDK